MEYHERLTLEPEPRSVRIGRRFLLDKLTEWRLSDLSDVAALLASEALTNAVVHARTPLVLAIRADPVVEGALRVEVIDGDPTPVRAPVVPPVAEPMQVDPRPDGESGRGLMMIDALAEQWGVTGHEVGKSVWFTVPLAR